MTLFKKKPSIPALHYSLNLKAKEAKESNKTSFYYTLEPHEIQQASLWAIHHHYWIELSHKTGEKLVYKISGI